ncbi:MAG: transglycosylase SLT domain-containing protein [Gemmatimonadota bacterium]
MRSITFGCFVFSLAAGDGLGAQSRTAAAADRYDDVFRKYSKRYFGPTYDWRIFKAQGMAESNLDPKARSRVGARGVMQLMPSTFGQIRSQQPELHSIDNPEMNIAAGVLYNRRLWTLWERDSIGEHRERFMLGSYNAGRRTILNAQVVVRRDSLDPRNWRHVEEVAPRVPRWRHSETIEYVRRIEANLAGLDASGRAAGRRPAGKP